MPPAPLPVLLHGFLGFDHIGPIRYFRGIASMLRRRGIEALFPRVPPAGAVADRAEALAAMLRRHPAPAFVLLGHSMGGLDARFLASHLDPDHRVACVVTVSTPHRGTPVASWMLEGSGVLPRIGRRFLAPALHDLHPATRLREPIPDRDDVRYVSYATVRDGDALPLPLRRFAHRIHGANDGLVPVDSALWGDFRGNLRADHLEVVGWSFALPDRGAGRPFDHRRFWYDTVLQAIATCRPGEEA